MKKSKIIYSNVSQLNNEDSKFSQKIIQQQQSNLTQIILTWSSMALAMLSQSVIGPIFKYMRVHGVKMCLAASWRCQCMVIVLFPIVIIENFVNKIKKKNQDIKNNQKNPDNSQKANSSNCHNNEEVLPPLPYPLWIFLLCAGFSWSANLILWLIALQFTTTVKASLYASLYPVMIVFYLTFTGRPVSMIEWFGVGITVVGVVLAGGKELREEFFGSNQNHQTHKYELVGDLLCLTSAAFQVSVIMNRKYIGKRVPLMMYTFITTCMVTLSTSLTSYAIGDWHLDFQAKWYGLFCLKESCLFGWMSPDWIGPMLMFGVVVGVLCIGAFNYANLHISPLVFSSINLLDPALTGIIAFMIGIEGVPELLIWIGGAVIVVGVATIGYGEHRRTRQADRLDQPEDKGSFAKVPVEEDEEGDELRDLSISSHGLLRARVASTTDSDTNEDNEDDEDDDEDIELINYSMKKLNQFLTHREEVFGSMKVHAHGTDTTQELGWREGRGEGDEEGHGV